MLPAALLNQIYLVSAILGVGFIGLNFLTGQLGGGGHGSGAGHAGAGGHALGAGHAGAGGRGLGAGHAGAGGHSLGAGHAGAGGHALVDAHGGPAGGHDFGASNENLPSPSISLHHALTAPSHTIVAQPRTFRQNIEETILGLLSPMSIAILLAFFGLAGLLLEINLPWLGALSLIPALLISLIVSNSFKTAVRWMAQNMEVSTESKVENLIGQVAEINIPCSDSATGEVIYVVGGKRYSAAARSSKAGVNIERGTKVIIADRQDHLLLIEPYTESWT
jgi:membrane protein implicated in regulation of membrane protease activity